jgi:hypothetical protein
MLVVTKLMDAWDLFLMIPVEHGDDIPEFRSAIHDAQRQVFMRVGRRQMNAIKDELEA